MDDIVLDFILLIYVEWFSNRQHLFPEFFPRFKLGRVSSNAECKFSLNVSINIKTV